MADTRWDTIEAVLQRGCLGDPLGAAVPCKSCVAEALAVLGELKTESEKVLESPSVDGSVAQESDLELVYIESESARILSQAQADEEISNTDVLWLRDAIGDLLGEVMRLLAAATSKGADEQSSTSGDECKHSSSAEIAERLRAASGLPLDIPSLREIAERNGWELGHSTLLLEAAEALTAAQERIERTQDGWDYAAEDAHRISHQRDDALSALAAADERVRRLERALRDVVNGWDGWSLAEGSSIGRARSVLEGTAPDKEQTSDTTAGQS